MSRWDVFLSDRLELRRGLSTAEVRAAWQAGEVRDDDLVRPAGSGEPWGRLADLSVLSEPEETSGPLVVEIDPEPESGPEPDPPDTPTASYAGRVAEGPPTLSMPELDEEPEEDEEPDDTSATATQRDAGAFAPIRDAPIADDAQAIPSFFAFDEEDVEDDDPAATEFDSSIDELSAASLAAPAVGPAATEDLGRFDLELGPEASRVSLPVARAPITWNEPVAAADLDTLAPAAEDEDDEAAAFTLARGAAETVEELDLAAMVDVAFQLVLFFLVTATTVLYKTLEVPRPNPEQAQAASQEGAQQAKSLEDLQADYILVEIDPAGAFTVDREPVAADFTALADRLRKARKDTSRTAMLLTADSSTLHRYAVLAYDVANEIGLRIAIAKPSANGPIAPPTPRPPAAKGEAG